MWAKTCGNSPRETLSIKRKKGRRPVRKSETATEAVAVISQKGFVERLKKKNGKYQQKLGEKEGPKLQKTGVGDWAQPMWEKTASTKIGRGKG